MKKKVSTLKSGITDKKIINIPNNESERVSLAFQLGNLTWWEWDFRDNTLSVDLDKLLLVNPDFKSPKNSLDELYKLVHPDDIDLCLSALEDYLSGKLPFFESEFRVKTKDNKWRWLNNKGTLVQSSDDNKPVKMFGLVIDVTDYKKASSKIKEDEEKLRNIFKSLPEAIIITTADFNFVDCNQEAFKVFGYEKKEFLELNLEKLTDVTNLAQLSSLLDKINKKGIVRNKELLFTRKNKKSFNGLISVSDVNNENRELQNYIFVIQNVTQFKEVEAELLQAKEKAEESDKLKSAFLTNMSHEIRTPMNAIIGFSDLLADPSLEKGEIMTYTGVIKERCNNLLQIVNDILDISRIEANEIELKENIFSVNSLLDSLYIVYAQKLINEDKLKVVLNLHKGIADKKSLIMADEGRLKQILSNLLDNAVKFTKTGEIDFGCDLHNNATLEFFVRDSGIGIHPDKHNIIFERFRQIDESLDREYGGNGLGLAICKAFVELMKGEIWLKSELGSGTAFFFTVPYKLAGSEEKIKPPETNIVNYKWNNKRILIVEDDRSSLAFMKVLFKLTHAKLVFVSKGQEAIELFMSDSAFDLILMDIQLPDINGLEVTKMIKAINRNIPVIAQTAYAMQGDEKKCMKAGCDDYVSKPIEISDLFYKIDRIFNRKYNLI